MRTEPKRLTIKVTGFLMAVKKKKKMGGGRRGVLQIKRHDESGQRVCHWCVSSLVARFEGGSKTEALTRL